MLNENGLKIGTHVKNLDIDEIENKILISSDMLSWISINLKGNVAYVQARNRLGNKNSESLTPANVVASRDGLVQEIEAYAGEIKIHNGQHVRKGDLLIGGIYDSNSRGYRYLRAKGNVFATTVRDIHIEIPFDYKEKVYTGMQKSENIYVFFSNRIKLSRNSRFLGATYDTIYRESEFCLPGGTRLPFSKCTITYIGYEYEDKVRSEEQAAELAYGQLESEISDILSEGATFIRKSITCGSDDSSYVIDCVLTLNENIAEISEFEVSD